MRLKEYGNRDEMPTEWEQDVAEQYVHTRQLQRPKTDSKRALMYTASFILVSCMITWILHYLFTSFGISNLLPIAINDFYSSNPVLSIGILFTTVVIVELILCSKYIVIGVVRLYQHYAPDDMRRRCLFMPTCSEYTIMAVRKYGAIIGLCKSYVRLVYRCRGNIFMIDYP
jgi:putative component of membrane protein insertase Oxa1/YidC/SpoIIIJ protein YidD